jgi:hypothetical protein
VQPPNLLLLPLLLLLLLLSQQTLENTREKDVTMVEEGDEEVALDEADDEFAGEERRINTLI